MPDVQDGALHSLLQYSNVDWWTQVDRIRWLVAIVVDVVLAIAVAVHARGRRTNLVPAWIWALTTVVTGPLGALAYWVVNVVRPGEAAKR